MNFPEIDGALIAGLQDKTSQEFKKWEQEIRKSLKEKGKAVITSDMLQNPFVTNPLFSRFYIDLGYRIIMVNNGRAIHPTSDIVYCDSLVIENPFSEKYFQCGKRLGVEMTESWVRGFETREDPKLTHPDLVAKTTHEKLILNQYRDYIETISKMIQRFIECDTPSYSYRLVIKEDVENEVIEQLKKNVKHFTIHVPPKGTPLAYMETSTIVQISFNAEAFPFHLVEDKNTANQ